MKKSSRKNKRKDIITWRKLLTRDEQGQLLLYIKSKTSTLKGRRSLLIVDLLLNTGLRASELCDLRVKDTPHILGRKVVEVFRGKGNKDRTIPISSRLAALVQDYINNDRSSTIPRFVKRGDTAKPLFYNCRQKRFNRQALCKRVKRIARKAGINKNVTPHTFRHTFATNVLIKGEPPYRLQRLLGHKSLVTTMKYVHFVEDMDEQIGERIDQCFEADLFD